MGQFLATMLRCCMPPKKWESIRYSPIGSDRITYGACRESVPFAQQPRMIQDEEEDSCFGCSVRFDVLVRRHHCRRCRNIYCQKCSKYTDRVLMYGEMKPVRLCHGCKQATPAENLFVERQIPLLLEGATLVRRALLAKRVVYLRVTADLSMLEETEPTRGGGRTLQHPLDDVESVAAANVAGGTGSGGGGEMKGEVLGVQQPVFVIRLRGRGQLKLEACTLAERDLWVAALEETVRRRRSLPLAEEVEEERWARREQKEFVAQRRVSAERRREHESLRTQMAIKYGLDPSKYVSKRPMRSGTERDCGEGVGSGNGSGSSGGGGVGDIGAGAKDVKRVIASAGRGVFSKGFPLLATVTQ